MTINSRLCKRFNTFSKSFIKCCDPYSVTGFTNTSHTGCYKQHEPLNKLHKSGWSHSTLSPKLGNIDPRPVGSPNCGWLPIRPTKDTTPVSGTKSDKNHSGEFKPSYTRGNRTVIKRDNSGDPIDSTQLHLPDIPSEEEGWWAEASDKPERPLSVCEGETFQDGGSSPPSISPTIRGKDSEDGPKRCIPPSAHQSLPSTPPLIPEGGELLYVHMPTLRSLCSTKGIHQTTETSSGLPPAGGMLSDNIPGRSTDLTPAGQGQTTTHGSTNQSALRGLRTDGQPQEVDSITCPELRISGVQHQLPMQISLPQEKMRKIQQDSSRLLAQQSVSVRQITQFVGKTTATLRALPTAPLHYRTLQFLMNSVAPVNYI